MKINMRNLLILIWIPTILVITYMCASQVDFRVVDTLIAFGVLMFAFINIQLLYNYGEKCH